MNIIVVGLSHKTAPVELRELLVVPDSRMGEALNRLMAHGGIREGMLLQTCNRVEVYAVVDQVEQGFSAVQEFFVDTHFSVSAEQLLPRLYCHAGDPAITHLFRVASSLDSLVVGEPQILRQVKDAFQEALTHNATGVVLNKVVKKAISVAKRVRTETRIAENAVSVSYAAVELAKKVFSNLAARTVMLVGAGEMAKLAAQHLVNHGVHEVLLTTRNPVRASAMAARFNGVSIPFDEFRANMHRADIVLCSTGASHYLISPEDVERAVRARWNRPIFLIDVSVPRNIDPDVRQVDNAFLFDIDDLESHIEQNREERMLEATRAEGIVKDEVVVIMKWLQALKATPTIIALRKRADALKQAELQKAFGRLGTLTPQQQETVEGLAQAIVNKLLHGPLVALKSAAQSSNGLVYIEAARRFYDLGQSLPRQESVDVRDGQDMEGEDAEPDAHSPESTEVLEQERISPRASGL
ncbi:MAG: glutamyl-tRNA reductase [Nitrospira sp.]|nr:glutamyl-tRNA reductase [Nitrospira sp.]